MKKIKYCFKYQLKPIDLWQLTMFNIYSSFLGTVNIIFTISMVLLAIKYWFTLNLILKFGLGVGVLLFIVIQPLAIYFKSIKQVKYLPKNIVMEIDDEKLYINSGNQNVVYYWNSIQGIVKIPRLIVIFISQRHGYVLPIRVLKTQKQEVYDYIKALILQNK